MITYIWIDENNDIIEINDFNDGGNGISINKDLIPSDIDLLKQNYKYENGVIVSNLDCYKKTKTKENTDKCIERFTQGITYNNILYDIDDTAKANINLILQNAIDSTDIPYLDYYSNIVNMTKADLLSLSAAIINLTKNIYLQQKSYVETILSCSTVEDVNAIVIDYSNVSYED